MKSSPSSRRPAAALLTLALMQGCSLSRVQPLRSGWRPTAAPECTTDKTPVRLDRNWAVVLGLGGAAFSLGAANIIPTRYSNREPFGAAAAGFLIPAVLLGTSALVGNNRVNQCVVAEEQWAEATREREKANALAEAARKAAQEKVEAKQIETADAAVSPPPLTQSTYRSNEGYQQARWGMSRDEVQAIYPQANERGGEFGFLGEVAGYETATGFGFSDGMLALVSVSLRGGSLTTAERMRAFSDLKSLLTQKYGAPRQDALRRTDSDPLGLIQDESTAILTGQAERFAIWELAESRIILRAKRGTGGIFVAVLYTSTKLFDRFIEAEDRKRANDL
jgi:hypothetical protein